MTCEILEAIGSGRMELISVDRSDGEICRPNERENGRNDPMCAFWWNDPRRAVRQAQKIGRRRGSWGWLGPAALCPSCEDVDRG